VLKRPSAPLNSLDSVGLMHRDWRDQPARALVKYGSMIKSPQGFPIQSPYLAIANRQAEIMMRIACEFGFTPASESQRRHRLTGVFSPSSTIRQMKP